MVGYVIVDITITDIELYNEYRGQVGDTIMKYDGIILMAAGEKEGSILIMEGKWKPNHLVVIQFESVDQAKKWYDSPEYTGIADIREKSSNSNFLIVEGL